MRALLAALILFAIAGCARSREVVAPPNERRPTDTWRSIVTEDDRGRLRHWRESWTSALAAARPANAEAIASQGPLLDPDAAQPGAALPAGDYHCRTLKLGALNAGHPVYSVGEPRLCRVAAVGERLHFTQLDGAQRAIGNVFPDGNRRMVLLGTLQLGDEALALRYGYDRERDLAGIVERVGENRWRIVFPAPHFESLLDVVELTPA